MTDFRASVLAFALGLLASLPASADDDYERGAAAYERALGLVKEGKTPDAIIELKNAVQAAPKYLPAWLELGRIYLDIGYGQLAEGPYERASELGADPSLTLLPRARSYLIQGKLDELLALDAAGRLAPEDEAALLVLQGNAQLEVGKLTEALTRFRAAGKLDPSSAAPLWGTAMVKLREGDLPAAQDQVERARALAPELAETWFVSADIARQAGRRADALADFSRAIDLEPGHMPARLGRAALLMDEGKLDAAGVDLAAVREAQPDDLQAMHLQALLFAVQGRQAEADQVLDAARARLRELPDRIINGNLPGLMLSALIAMKDGQPAQAVEHLTRYLARVRNHLGANKLLAAAYLQDGRHKEARAILEPLMARHPQDAAILNLLGTAFVRAGDDRLAAAMLERAIELGADTPAVRQQLGQLRLAQGDTAAASEAFARAAAQDPGGDAAFMLALTALREGSIEGAQQTIDQLLAARPDEPAYHNLKGSVALLRNDPAAARAAWARALEIEADYPPATANLAALARTEGRLDEAKRLYEHILTRHPQNADALRGLADTAVAAGRHKEAIRHFRDLLKQRPGDVDLTVQLIRSRLAMQDMDGARAELAELRQKRPDDVRARLIAIDLDVAAGKGEQAAAALREALVVARPDIAAMRLVMQRQVQYGALGDALETAQAVLQLRPTDLRSQQEIGELEIQLKRFGAAAARARELESRFADSPIGPGLRAKVALAEGRAQEAVEALTLARSRAPDMPELAVALAQARLAAGDLDTGFAELAALAEKHPVVRPQLADAELAAGRWPEAAATLERILAQDPTNTAALNNLTWAYLQAGDPRARDSARRLLKAAPTDVASLDTAGWVLVEAGEPREGVGILRDALARAPGEAIIRYHLAAGLAKLGEKAEALKLLEDLPPSGKFPERPAAEELRQRLRAAL